MTENTTTKNERPIHPAIDFTSEHAYIGRLLQISELGRGPLPCLISDDRTFTPIQNNALESNGIRILHQGFGLRSRWSTESIEGFIRGETPTIERTKLFNKIKECFEKYIELQDSRLHELLSLWCIGTYFFPLFNAYPYIYVGGISGSGKTKLLTLCSSICFNSVLTGDISLSCLFRLVQTTRCSVFMDESEVLSNKYTRADLRNLLLSGYKRGLSVYRNRRTSDSNFEPEAFELYGPKMLVNIEGLESVLGNRCIDIIMQRGSNRNITAKEMVFDDPVWQQIRDLIYPFLMQNWKSIRQFYDEQVNEIDIQNREWELWKPILALARFFDSSALYQDIKTLAIERSNESQTESIDIHEAVLVETLMELVDHDGYYPLTDIKNEFILRLEDYNFVNSRYLGNILRRLGFTQHRRVGSGYEYFLQTTAIRNLARSLRISECSEHSERPAEQDTETQVIAKEIEEVRT